MKRIALYPGTFDPVTNGHLDIIYRASSLCDLLIIGVAENIGKNPFFKISQRKSLIQDAINQIKGIEGSLIAMSPEGTRSKVKEWKTGFLRIAKEINAQIVPASLDFSKKEILLGKVFKLSGDNKKDILDLKKYYSVFTAKHPDKY